jgi:molybdopterin-binding protein
MSLMTLTTVIPSEVEKYVLTLTVIPSEVEGSLPLIITDSSTALRMKKGKNAFAMTRRENVMTGIRN